MKIIDEKGMLLGRINIIDFLVAMVLISLVPMVYYGQQILTKRNIEETKWVEVKVRFTESIPGLTEALKEGDVEESMPAKVVGKMKKIAIGPSDQIVISADKNSFLKLDHSQRKDLVVTLDILCTIRSKALFYNKAPVRIGEELIFTTYLYKISGTIISISSV